MPDRLLARSPALRDEQLESGREALRYGQVEAVVADPPDDGRRVDVLIRDLVGQQLPQHDPERPGDNRRRTVGFYTTRGR